MKGSIQSVNARNAFAAVLTREGTFTVFEVLTGSAEAGDLVSWTGMHPEGIRTVRNLTRDTLMRVLFRDHALQAGHLRKMMEDPEEPEDPEDPEDSGSSSS
jgi:hypothetical protein